MEYCNKVSIVIPVYGQWHLVKKNVDSCLDFDDSYIEEIIIVDDCSPTNNPYNFPEKVLIIKNKINKGYTGTVNEGLKRAKAGVVVLLDSDAYLVKPFINDLIRLYTSDKRLGCVGFSTVDEYQNSTGNFQYPPTLFGFIVGQMMEEKLSKLINLFVNTNKKLPFSCAVSFRKQALIDLNYFDEESFPVLDADNDLSLRFYKSNWNIFFSNDLIVCHKGGNSIPRDYKRVLLFYKSRWQLLQKHDMIFSKKILKILLIGRVFLEVLIIYIGSKLNTSNERILNKLIGRQKLLMDIKTYS